MYGQYCLSFADLCRSFFDHFQLTLVDLDAPEETIKEPQEDPACQPGQKEKSEKMCNRNKQSKRLAVGQYSAFWSEVTLYRSG